MRDRLDKDFYSVRELSEMFGVSDQLFYDAIKSGRIRGIRVGARRVVVPREEIERLKGGPLGGRVAPSERREEEEFGA